MWDVAKELSRIFEYQVVELKNEAEMDKLADCAVDLMLDLKKDDLFDRDTLLKKVLQDGRARKQIDLWTNNDDKWKAPDVFRKPGLRKERDYLKLTHFVKPTGEDACDIKNYGYRSQFLEMKYGRRDRDETPSANEVPANDVGYYFVDSEIDLNYTVPRNENAPYHPIHVLVRNSKVLDHFIANQHETGKPSLASFVSEKIENLPKNHLVYPVYRPDVPRNIPNLQNSDLSGSDFSYADFRNSFLMSCNFTKCVMLFTNVRKANISDSTFDQTLIKRSDLSKVRDDMDINKLQNYLGIWWRGTVTSKMKVERMPDTLDTATTNVVESISMNRRY